MPPHQGRHGIGDFTKPTSATNPKQECNLPHEGDPFCGNDNNRRAHLTKLIEQAKANPDEFDGEAAIKSLGGEERVKKAIAGHPQLKAALGAPVETDVAEDDDKQDADSGDQAGSQDAQGSDDKGQQPNDESKPTKAKSPKAPAQPPTWQGNA